MSNANLLALSAALCTIALSVPLSIFYCTLTIRTVWLHSHGNNNYKNRHHSSVSHLSRVKESHSSIIFTHCLTAMTSACFTLSQILSLSWMCMVLTAFINTKKHSVWHLNADHLQYILINFLHAICLVGAYVGLLFVCFNRLKNTFDSTQYSLNYKEQMLGYLMLCFLMIDLLSAVLSYTFIGPTISSVFLSVFLLSWFISSLFLSWSFFNRSMKLSNNLTLNNQVVSSSDPHNTSITSGSKSKSNSNSIHITDIERRSDYHNRNGDCLMHASLRLFILSSVVSVTTAIGFGMLLIAQILRSSPLWFIAVMVHDLDCLVNVFSLLCTFKERDPYYQWVYGYIHHYCWNRLIS